LNYYIEVSELRFEEGIELYTVSLYNQNLGETTISDYTEELERFKDFLLEHSREYIDEIETFDIERYFALMVKNGNAPNTRNKKRSVLNGFFEYLTRRRVIEENPVSSIHSVKVRDTDVNVAQPLNRQEINKLKETIRKKSRFPEKNIAIIDLLGNCGLRVEELTGVLWSDINKEESSLLVRGKGGKIRYVPIFNDVMKNLNELRKKQPKVCDYVINYKNKNRGVSTRSIFDTVKRYVRESGLDESVGCHTLRSSAATNFLTSGVNVKYIQMLLGHSDISTTSRYLRPMDEEMAKALEEAYAISLEDNPRPEV